MLSRALAIAGVLVAAPACLVLAIDRFYDAGAIVSDDRLLGTWTDTDDNVTVTIERSEWQSYRLAYVHPIETGVLTGYLFKAADAFYLDLTVARGQDPGTFVVAGHTVVRVEIAGEDIMVTPLSYAWFSRAASEKSLAPALVPERSQRDQILLAAPRAAISTWLAERKHDDPAFAAPVSFRKQP